MSSSEILFFVLLALGGLLCSGLFSGLETGMYTLNAVRLNLRAADGERSAQRLLQERRVPARLLTLLLIATNIANWVTSYGFAELLDESGLSQWRLVWLQALILTPILFIFAETLPKEMFRVHTDRWSYGFAVLLTTLRWVLTIIPVLPLIRGATLCITHLLGSTDPTTLTARQRVHQLLQEGVQTGVLSSEQSALLDRALAMQGRRVADVMVPWRKVMYIDETADNDLRLLVLQQAHYSRFPVVATSGAVLGILNAIDILLDPAEATSDLMDEVMTIPGETPVLHAITNMREQGTAMAVVLSGTSTNPAGIVTLKNLVEPVTGRIISW